VWEQQGRKKIENPDSVMNYGGSSTRGHESAFGSQLQVMPNSTQEFAFPQTFQFPWDTNTVHTL
jgi:hypothetical protein